MRGLFDCLYSAAPPSSKTCLQCVITTELWDSAGGSNDNPTHRVDSLSVWRSRSSLFPLPACPHLSSATHIKVGANYPRLHLICKNRRAPWRLGYWWVWRYLPVWLVLQNTSTLPTSWWIHTINSFIQYCIMCLNNCMSASESRMRTPASDLAH